ncbi:hypothetical protein [Cryptosporangium minutisporangium]|uniref:Flagellar biosynthesis protein FlgA n=1 Tax=Cryptosporangium minutisporangium TaxID=113569 RepID=A0ABP6T2D7_9ACTN
MRRTERLAAPRVWLPRGGWPGRVRAACAGALVVTAAVILAYNHDSDVRQQANPGAPTSVGSAPAPPGREGTAPPGQEGAGPPGREGIGPSAGSGSASTGAGESVPAGAGESVPAGAGESEPAGAGEWGPASADGPEASGGDPRGVAPPPGTVGFPLRLTDPAVLAVVHPGERVDVLVRAEGGTAHVVAADLPVLRSVGTAAGPDGVLYLAVSPAQATVLAAIGPDAQVSVTVRSPG